MLRFVTISSLLFSLAVAILCVKGGVPVQQKWFHEFFSCKTLQVQIASVFGDGVHYIFKICQIIPGISMINQFHEFLDLIFGGFLPFGPIVRHTIVRFALPSSPKTTNDLSNSNSTKIQDHTDGIKYIFIKSNTIMSVWISLTYEVFC